MANFPYDEQIEILMIRTFNNISEKERRNYAAVEAIKLGHGGIKYISQLFKIDPKTIRNGIIELKKRAIVNQGKPGEKEEGENPKN
jgi:hypothetical protein